MPELPEVETIRRSLIEQRICGRSISGLTVDDCRIFQVDPVRLAETLPGQKILQLGRRGKFLIFKLERSRLILHLGMTGQVTFRDPERLDDPDFRRHPVTGLQRARQHAPDKHTHLQIHFQDGSSILLRDVRKFGKVYLCHPRDAEEDGPLSRLGLEPLTPGYTLERFLNGFRNRKLKIKSLLLDQKFVAGIGNIYADEALYEAGLHPARTVRSLRRYEKERLFRAIPKVLQRSILHGGTSFRDYVNSGGVPGGYQEQLQVYGRSGLACRRCEAIIRKIVLSQRGTHFCPDCQPRAR